MAGGIDWFRWHHGSVTDPKFQLVARRAGVSLPVVLAVWAFVLEKASAADSRGTFGEIDCESVDCLFGIEDGKTQAVLEQMNARGLLGDGSVCAWDKRQPKRERDADSSTERTRAYRERQSMQRDAKETPVTPCDATERQETPREEKRREEENLTSSLRSEATDGGVGAPPKSAVQMTKDELWVSGKSLLEQQGMPKAQCGSFVGKLVKDYGPEVVVDAVRSAVVERPADAASFLKAACMSRSSKAAKPSIHDIPTREAFAGPVAVDGAGRPIAIPTEQSMEGVM